MRTIKRGFAILIIGLIFSIGFVSADVISHWKFDDNYNDAYELHPGSPVGDPVFLDGKISKAVSFNGNDYVDVSNLVQLDGNDYTISGWIRTSSAIGLQQVLMRYEADDYKKDLELFISEGKLFSNARDQTLARVSISTKESIADGKWHHFAFTRLGNTFSLYKDGILESSTVLALSDIDAESAIFRFGNGIDNVANRFFTGELDDFKLLDYALSADEVKNEYSTTITVCDVLLSDITNFLNENWIQDCNSIKYKPVLDVNKDKKIDNSDLLMVSQATKIKNVTWCEDAIYNARNPCFKRGDCSQLTDEIKKKLVELQNPNIRLIDGKKVHLREGEILHVDDYILVGNKKEEMTVVELTNVVNSSSPGISYDRARFVDMFTNDAYDAKWSQEGIGTVYIKGKWMEVTMTGFSDVDYKNITLNWESYDEKDDFSVCDLTYEDTSCTDSDGRDYNKKGYIELNDPKLGYEKKYDFCLKDKYNVQDYYCVDEKYEGYDIRPCINGCDDGACKSEGDDSIVESVSLFSGGRRIYQNDPLNKIKNVLTKADLPNLLNDGNFDNKYYIHTLVIGDSKLVFKRQPSSSNPEQFGFETSRAQNKFTYNSDIAFSKSIDFTNKELWGEELYLFGRKYFISPESNTNQIILLNSAKKIILDSDKYKTKVSLKDKSYTIELISASDDSAVIEISDDENSDTKEIIGNNSKEINGLKVHLISADESDLSLSAILLISSPGDRLILQTGNPVLRGYKGSEFIVDGTIVTIASSTTNTKEVYRITVGVYAPDSDKDAIVVGEPFVDPVFGTFRINFKAMSDTTPSDALVYMETLMVPKEEIIEEIPLVCPDGCLLDESCVPIGYRTENEFCNKDGTLEKQYGKERVCYNNFECSSNVCLGYRCIDEGLFKKFLDWLKNFFG